MGLSPSAPSSRAALGSQRAGLTTYTQAWLDPASLQELEKLRSSGKILIYKIIGWSCLSRSPKVLKTSRAC